MSLSRCMIGLALVGVLALAGCSSNEGELSAKSAFSVLKTAFKRSELALDEAKLTRVGQRALSRTDEPLAAVQFPSVKAQSVVRVIETNGEYSTWSSWGTAERRTLTTKRGIITATRAIPPDLMSADVDEVLELVTRREEGSAYYAQRYLDGDHKVIEAKTFCEVTRGYEKFVEFGEIRAPALQMFANCIAADRQFVDLYMVDNSGHILQSRQWVGPTIGFAIFQRLR